MVRLVFMAARGNCRWHIASAFSRGLAAAEIDIVHLTGENHWPHHLVCDALGEVGVQIEEQTSRTLTNLGTRPVDLVIELSAGVVVNRAVLSGTPSVIAWDVPDLFAADEPPTLGRCESFVMISGCGWRSFFRRAPFGSNESATPERTDAGSVSGRHPHPRCPSQDNLGQRGRRAHHRFWP